MKYLDPPELIFQKCAEIVGPPLKYLDLLSCIRIACIWEGTIAISYARVGGGGVKGEFFDTLHETVSCLQRKDGVIILGDFIARVGNKRGMERGDWRVWGRDTQ